MRMKEPSDHFEDCDVDINACATTDCTGLIPSLPTSEAELESYNELYHFLPPDARIDGETEVKLHNKTEEDFYSKSNLE